MAVNSFAQSYSNANGTQTYSFNTYPLSPALSATNPVGSSVASNFMEYSVNSLTILLASTNTINASGVVGMFIVGP